MLDAEREPVIPCLANQADRSTSHRSMINNNNNNNYKMILAIFTYFDLSPFITFPNILYCFLFVCLFFLLWYHVGCPCVRPSIRQSVCRTSVRPYFRFRAIT